MKLLIVLQAILVSSSALLGSVSARSDHTIFVSNKQKVHLEERCGLAAKPAAIIFLHGSGGPNSGTLPYRDDEGDLVKQGYCIYTPHYLDATGGLAEDPRSDYPIWVQVVEDTVKHITSSKGITADRIALVGYSLGASVALAAGAKDPRFAAIVEFSGSLPDDYRPMVESFPPLLIIHGRDDSFIPVGNAIQLGKLCRVKHFTCSEQLYVREGHSFSIAAIMRSKHLMGQFLREHVPV